VIIRQLRKLEKDKADAARLYLEAAPAVFVNGVLLPDLSRPALELAIELALLQVDRERR
jgi:hypothetical protein